MAHRTANLLPNYVLFESPLFTAFLPELGWGADFHAVALGLREQGYAVVDFPHPDFSKLAAGLVESVPAGNCDNKGDNPPSNPVEDAWKTSDAVREIACNTSIMKLIRSIYGRTNFPFSTRNFFMGADSPPLPEALFFNSRPERFLCCVWVALEDVDGENGPLAFYPGTHKWPVYTPDQLGIDISATDRIEVVETYRAFYERLVDGSGVEPHYLHLRKGQAAIWAANMIYRGVSPKSVDKTRWSQLTRYYFNGCSYWDTLESNTGMGDTRYICPMNLLTGRHERSVYLGRPLSASAESDAGDRPVESGDVDDTA